MAPPTSTPALIYGPLRSLEPEWNTQLIAASIAISLLGAFTSTQLMCQARTSYHFSTVLVWTLLSSITFGFCSVWCLHEVAMLACELDLPIGVDAGLTMLSALLATGFTFGALSSDLLYDRYKNGKKRFKRRRPSRRTSSFTGKGMWSLLPSHQEEVAPRPAPDDTNAEEYRDDEDEARPLTQDVELEEQVVVDSDEDISDEDAPTMTAQSTLVDGSFDAPTAIGQMMAKTNNVEVLRNTGVRPAPFVIPSEDPSRRPSLLERSASEESAGARSMSNASTFGLHSLVNVAWARGSAPVQNVFVLTAKTLWAGLTGKNFTKGFFWSLAITSMHYVGIAGLRVPSGYYTLDPVLFIASAIISWVVCVLGTIFMAQMETHLPQQILFSVVATTGVACMHFTGMRAVTFYSTAQPSENRGYPPELPIAVASIAIITCIAANGLLAHSATVSRNKLAEIVYTRKQLWRTIAQKENAEAAAAARSDFIASASHEIRTPLHHLQGYSDLLSRTEMTEEGRMLLACIQRATQTLSLITNNVLDWSRLEKDSEGICRPIALDIRMVCESVIVLLPNKDDEAEVDLLVVVAPEVPHSLFLDETYIHRILMNLLSNAIKFTRSGYILLSIEMKDGKLVASVTDTGCGVPPSFLPIMFEPFKQAQTRGSQRGTGLGLSIIKQLLSKMGGTIDVQSKYFEEPGVEASETGSTFTITLPVQSVNNAVHEILPPPAFPAKVAIFHTGNARSMQGVAKSWERFGYEAVVCKDQFELSFSDWSYIWADLPALKQDPTLLTALINQTKFNVLIPCDTLTSPQELPELVSPPSHFIYLPKPLIWHTFEQRVAATLQPAPITKGVRFAAEVEVVEAKPGTALQSTQQAKDTDAKEEKPPKGTILLVEDNPINQKLGRKMLTILGYTVLTALDGVEAITSITTHDLIVDAILMDQSMPGKDGLTATREIREMEAQGQLKKRHPVVAVTAVVSTEAEQAFAAVGADGFLAKPLSLKRLEDTLDSLLVRPG